MPEPDKDEAITTKVRGDHTHWRCRDGPEGEECNERYEMSQENCTSCGSRRKKGSWAEATNGDVLGTLQSFGPDGEAVWYYETHRNGCS
jgi:hypothetical protein